MHRQLILTRILSIHLLVILSLCGGSDVTKNSSTAETLVQRTTFSVDSGLVIRENQKLKQSRG